MKVSDLLKIDCLKLITKDVCLDKEISDLYTCDLLSWVMGHVHEENVVLLTVLNSMNAVALATLLDMSAIIFCEDVMPSDDIIKKANEENVPLFTSSKSSYKSAKEILKYESLL